ncbi:hypothetical protein FRC03_010926 [Tulasnella sp. 419]|nr:hypothetical protein FRC02_011021 [Tulasnella sp. 418]KAG8966971.1 hypothetical protein FRC03_010926 [Tulasnella sp. 419]
MGKYQGQTVRLTCKILKFAGDQAIVQAPDGGEITVKLLRDANISDTYVDFVGKVVDQSTLKMLQATNWGSDVDMDFINKAIEQLHRFGQWT